MKQLFPKRQRSTTPETTGLLQNEMNTIDKQQASSVVGYQVNLNENNSNNNTIPEDFKLQEFETEDDDYLLDYIRSNPIDVLIDVPQTNSVTNNMTTMNNTLSSSMPVIPKMYFPQSNVTINYHFHK